MTVTPDPSLTPQTAIINVWQAVAALLGILGVSLPPLFTNFVVEQQAAGIVLSLIGVGSLLYSHFKKTAVNNSLRANVRAMKGYRT